MSRGSATLSLRTDVNPIAVAADARRIVTELLGADSVRRVTTLAEQVDAAVVPERLMAILGGFFGAVGALLAAIGLYGLLAYTVARRTKEIGIRMALGATRGDVTRMMLRSGLTLVAAGLVVGAPVAFWGTRFAATAIEDLSGGGVPPDCDGGRGHARGCGAGGVHAGAPRHARRARHRAPVGIALERGAFPYAAVQENSKFSGLQAPATNAICSERSPSGVLFAF